MSDKPRVRQLPQTSDRMEWRVTWRGKSKIAMASSCQMAVNPSGIAAEMEFQVNKKLIEIERELA